MVAVLYVAEMFETEDRVKPKSNQRLILLTVAAAMSAASAVAVPIVSPTFSKGFNPPTVTVGGTVALQFEITNPNGITIFNIGFSDALGAGLTATGAVNGSCGAGTIVAAGSTVSLTGASLAAGASSTFSVDATAMTAGVVNNSVSVQYGCVLDGPAPALCTGNTATATLAVVTPPRSDAFQVR
jgi:uncharacterized repeat protein (TIGR01451 family)